MRRHSFKHVALGICVLLAAVPAYAHLNYNGRDFGSFSQALEKSLMISGQTVISNFGWADGTDSDFGDSHRLRIFRFTLDEPMQITISIQGGAGFLPGFSLYSGLAHLAPADPDHDGAPITLSYLQFLGGGKEGAFVALNNWRLGNDAGSTFSDLTTFMFEGYGVDGTAANFGPTPGIIGDGLANGFVSKTFPLLAGDYSFFVGGADYGGSVTNSFPISVGVSNAGVVPEPGKAVTLLGGLATLFGLKRARQGRP